MLEKDALASVHQFKRHRTVHKMKMPKRGSRVDLALFLVVGAADGYHAVFALPELDHAFTDRIIILADRRDGKPLAEKEGPLRIVVPDEKREARWVRQVVSL